jgi:hypothetical protein
MIYRAKHQAPSQDIRTCLTGKISGRSTGNARVLVKNIIKNSFNDESILEKILTDCHIQDNYRGIRRKIILLLLPGICDI